MNELTPGEKLHGKWFLMYKKNIPGSQWKYIHAPSGFFYADPFLIRKNELDYVFFELFDYNRGKIAYLTIDGNNNHSEPKEIDIPITTHVSYPYILEDAGKLYMIPETCHQNKINIYECVSFPDKWIFKTTLINGVHAADTDIVKHNGKYWLFTQILKDRQYRTCIFYSDTLFGQWHPHKLVNVENDISILNNDITRNAGKIYTICNTLMRPAQYSRRGMNGEAVILYKIEILNENEYHEVPTRIISENAEIARCVHTFFYSDISGFLIMDGRKVRDMDKPYEPFDEETELKLIMEYNSYANHDLLKEAFSLNTSGNGKCYYSASIRGNNRFIQYEGERNWDSRWELIKNCMTFEHKRVLDIGCNNGILMVYLKKYRNIKSGLGIEQPDDLLKLTNKADTIKSFDLLAKGFFVSDLKILQMDINKTDYENIIGYEFDIVSAMSILKWIENKDRFIKFLSKFNKILYEGHESDEEELIRFTNLGYNYKILGKTQTGKSYSANNTRTLILFSK